MARFTGFKTVALLAVLTLTLAACSTTTVEKVKPRNEMSKISVLALDNNNIQIKPTDTFKWRDDFAVVGVEKEGQEATAERLSLAIEEAIEAKGHDFIDDRTQASNFQLSAMAILDKDGGEEHSLVLRFGIDPGLGHSHMQHDKGSLVLGVMDNEGVLLWRGIVQIFTDDALDGETRKLRTQRAIDLLLKELFSKTVVAAVASSSTSPSVH